MLRMMRWHNLPIESLPARVCAMQLFKKEQAVRYVVLLTYKD